MNEWDDLARCLVELGWKCDLSSPQPWIFKPPTDLWEKRQQGYDIYNAVTIQELVTGESLKDSKQ